MFEWIDTKTMNRLALAWQMLFYSKRKLIGMLIGSTLAAFIVMQQPSIYQGICDRIVAQISTINEVDLWVVGADSTGFDSPTYFKPMDLFRVRSVPGVEWAVQLYRTWYYFRHVKTDQGMNWELLAVDPERKVGLPKRFIAGDPDVLAKGDGLVIDGYSLKQFETEKKETLALGDKLDDRAKMWSIAAITRPLRTYMYQPKAYILSSHLPGLQFRPSFILVKVAPNAEVSAVAKQIQKRTGYDALTPSAFEARALDFFDKKTPISIIFVCVAFFGFLIGVLILGQIFSNFILSHLHQLGMLKMIGVSNAGLTLMVLFQAFVVGSLGFFFGLVLDTIFGLATADTQIAFHLTFKIVLLGLLGTLAAVLVSAYISLRRVLRLDSIELCRDENG